MDGEYTRAVIIEPQMNIIRLALPSIAISSVPDKSAAILNPSPATMQNGKGIVARERLNTRKAVFISGTIQKEFNW